MHIPKCQNAYEISISEISDEIEFLTDHKLKYKIYVSPGRKIIPGFVFTSSIIYFGFYTKANNIPADPKVLKTIINFLIDLLEDRDTIVAYIYSSGGNKHLVRERYFNTLFEKHSNGHLHKNTFDLGEDGKAVILFRADNIYLDEIQNLSADEIIKRMEEKEKYDEFYS